MVTKRQRVLGYALIVGLNLVVLAAGLLAIGWWRREQGVAIPSRIEGTITEGFFEPAPDVGYIPIANKRVTSRRVADWGTIYDVVYTIGPDHFRIVPHEAAPVDDCVAVFGDSFAFGEGLNDQDTLAWQLASAADHKIGAKNFGVGGWGPNQLLGGLQSGRFQRALTCSPRIAIFTMIGSHMRRVSGREPWAKGPRYQLDANGSVVRVGNLEDIDRATLDNLDEGMLRWRRLFGVRRSGTIEDADLTLAIFRKSQEVLRQLPGSPPLHILYWDDYVDSHLERLFDGLKAAGIQVHTASRILPDFESNHSAYELSPADRHPNAVAAKLAARYIAEKLLPTKQEPRTR